MMMKLEDIIQGCKHKDSYSEKQLFNLYSGKIFSLCLRYAINRHEAEDILQDTFVRVFEKISQFNESGSIEGWIRRIAINISLRRISKSSYKLEENPLDEVKLATYSPDVISSLGVEELMVLIRGLPDGYRVVFNLNVIEGYSHKEIAKMLSISESTSRTQLLKARRALQAKVIDLYKINEIR